MANLRDYRVIALTHRQMRLQDLASFILPEGDGGPKGILAALKNRFGFEELLYVHTCNRVLFLFTVNNDFTSRTTSEFFRFLYPALSENEMEIVWDKHIYLEGHSAVMHLFKVASSIDSLVIGEREILRQLRESFHVCKKWGLTGDNIRLLMRITIETAKKIYADTRIGEKPLSVVSLAMQKMRQRVHNTEARCLLVGAGQTMELVGKFLKKRNFTNITVFNRSLAKAENLAAPFAGKAFTLDQIEEYKQGFDVMIICTGSTEPVITVEKYHSLLNGDQSPKTVIDLALPNNVSAEAVEQFTMHYVQLEDLRTLAKANLAFREEEAERVRHLLEDEVVNFGVTFEQRQIERAMKDVPKQVKAVKAHAMEEVFKAEITRLQPTERELLERMMTYMEKKCISIPMSLAKEMVRK